jgi:quercetin dioxygenase-like cupin family protein
LAYFMRLLEDRLMVGAEPQRLPPLHRVLFVPEGEPRVASQSGEQSVATGHAWYGHEPCGLRAGDANARVLRFELYRDHPPELDGGRLKLAHSIDLDPGAAWLMRCDRVDFEPAGEAPLHRHRGGGIRCLLRGAIEITVGDEPARRILPGGAWFESGREPVYAAAARDEETSFIRVTVQPAEIRGRSSIMYVNPADATRKPRSYRVFIDEPIRVR